jgi:serine/threonine protein kinase
MSETPFCVSVEEIKRREHGHRIHSLFSGCQISHDKLEPSPFDPSLAEEIDQGRHSYVYKCVYQAEEVAVKLFTTKLHDLPYPFCIRILKLLQCVGHEKNQILPLKGISIEGEYAALVMNLAQGSLAQVIEQKFDPIDCLLQISQGLKYLHSQDLFQGELNPDHIFWKLADGRRLWYIGPCSFSQEIEGKHSSFIPPECLFYDQPLDSTSDIYSFGVLMREIRKTYVFGEEYEQLERQCLKPHMQRPTSETIATFFQRYITKQTNAKI